MEVVKKIDQRCAETLPYYNQLSKFTTKKYQQGLSCVDSLYSCSNNKVKKMNKLSKQVRSDIVWILSQAADDLLQLIETKFSIQSNVKGKAQRLQRIYNSIKEEKLQPYVQKLLEMNEKVMNRGKKIHQENIYPLFLRVKATVEVSRQILLEALSERITQLKMTYECSKDSVKMFWSGEFKEEKIVEQMKDKFGCLKQFTVSFVKKGMEIEISKQDLVENYHYIMEKMSQMMKQAGEKGVTQWTQTKTKTINLYQTVLRRIKEKERMLTVKYTKLEVTQEAEQKSVEQNKDRQEKQEEVEENKTGSESQD